MACQEEVLVVEEVGSLLITGAKWLALQAAGYLAGKMVDKATGSDTETQLKAAEARLLRQLNAGAAAHRAQIEAELRVARSEISVLNNLMNGRVSTERLDRDRKEIDADLATLRTTLAAHEKALAEHRHRLDEHDKRFERQGEQIKELQNQMKALQPSHGQQPAPHMPPETRWAPPSSRVWAPRPSPGPWFPALPSPPLIIVPGASSHGPAIVVSLVIRVQGDSNLIRLAAALRNVARGTFDVPVRSRVVRFYVPPGTGAIVELHAPGTLISAPASLMSRIRIRSYGWPFESLIYR